MPAPYGVIEHDLVNDLDRGMRIRDATKCPPMKNQVLDDPGCTTIRRRTHGSIAAEADVVSMPASFFSTNSGVHSLGTHVLVYYFFRIQLHRVPRNYYLLYEAFAFLYSMERESSA